MNDSPSNFIPIAEIRCGKFRTQLGFLRVDSVGEWQCMKAPQKDAHRDPAIEMPIISWAWDGSGYKPCFQSLN